MNKCHHGKRMDENCLVCEKLSEIESMNKKEMDALQNKLILLEEAIQEKITEWHLLANQMFYDDNGEGGRSDVLRSCVDELDELLKGIKK